MASGSSRNASFLDYLHLSFAAEYSRDLKQRRTKIGRRFLSPVIPSSLPSVYTHRALLSNRASFLVSTIFKARNLSALLLRVHRAAKYLSRRLYFFPYLLYLPAFLREWIRFFFQNRKKKCHVSGLRYIIQ